MIGASTRFAIAVPPAWATVDLLDPETRAALPPDLGAALGAGAGSGAPARLMTLQALIAVTREREPLAAGLTVMLAEPAAPVSSRPLVPEAFAGAEVSAIALPAGSGIRVRETYDTDFQGLAIEALRVQYHLQTVHGLLTITFSTPQAAQTEPWEELFDALAATAELT